MQDTEHVSDTSVWALDFSRYTLPIGIYVNGQERYLALSRTELNQLQDMLEGKELSPALTKLLNFVEAAGAFMDRGGMPAQTKGEA